MRCENKGRKPRWGLLRMLWVLLGHHGLNLTASQLHNFTISQPQNLTTSKSHRIIFFGTGTASKQPKQRLPMRISLFRGICDYIDNMMILNNHQNTLSWIVLHTIIPFHTEHFNCFDKRKRNVHPKSSSG